jgi:hypothetical protein
MRSWPPAAGAPLLGKREIRLLMKNYSTENSEEPFLALQVIDGQQCDGCYG